MSVLVVDDEKDIGLMISLFLKKEGFKTDHAIRINQARQMIKENDYELYFLDLSLPDGTGFDLIPTIRQKNKSSVIVVISAYNGTEEMQKAQDMGVNRFIKKPFMKKDIISVINGLQRDKS